MSRVCGTVSQDDFSAFDAFYDDVTLAISFLYDI